jgi:hypothetical protein
MERDVQKKIEEFVEKHNHPKDCECYQAGKGVRCKAKDIGLESYVVCLNHDPIHCKHSLFFGDVYFCTCSIRITIAKEFGI